MAEITNTEKGICGKTFTDRNGLLHPMKCEFPKNECLRQICITTKAAFPVDFHPDPETVQCPADTYQEN